MAGERREAARFFSIGTPELYNPSRDRLKLDPFSRPKVDFSREPPGVVPVVNRGGRWYRQVDDGRADRFVPTTDPSVSPAELAAQRAAIDRAFYMAENPLAALGYIMATFAGASPQTRDRAMVAGGAVNTALVAAAPLGARGRSPVVRAPAVQPPTQTTPRASIRYGQASATGQASYGAATVTKSMLGTGKRVKKGLVPPGLLDSSTWDRGHLIAKGLGGSARSPQEVVALDRRVNRGPMNSFEKSVMARVRAGEVVDYVVNALYGPKASAPSAIVMSANGSRGGFTPKIIQNPAGRRK